MRLFRERLVNVATVPWQTFPRWQSVARLLIADLAREESSFSVVPLASDTFHLQHLLHLCFIYPSQYQVRPIMFCEAVASFVIQMHTNAHARIYNCRSSLEREALADTTSSAGT